MFAVLRTRIVALGFVAMLNVLAAVLVLSADDAPEVRTSTAEPATVTETAAASARRATPIPRDASPSVSRPATPQQLTRSPR